MTLITIRSIKHIHTLKTVIRLADYDTDEIYILL